MKKTHPTLYKTYMTFAFLSIALGLNFIFLTPTFMPLDVSKWVVGLILLGDGFVKLLLLLLNKHLHALRMSMAICVAIYIFWSIALTYDWWRLSQTSLQLPLTYVGLSVLGFWLLAEPAVNPATERHDDD